MKPDEKYRCTKVPKMFQMEEQKRIWKCA